MMSRILPAALFFCSLALVGCASIEDYASSTNQPPPSKVFVGTFDEVWRATQKALVRYPIQTNNVDKGIIETDRLKLDAVWDPPVTPKPINTNLKYKLTIKVLKGRTNQSESSKVTIFKNVLLERDFFSGQKELPSDRLEEASILYRIDRELILEKSLRKSFEKSGR